MKSQRLEAYIRHSAREKATYILKSEHATLLKKREDELITDMRQQFVKGHAEMRRQTAEVVESSLSEHRAEITCLEQDKQLFVNALAEYMNEVTF